MQKSVNFFTQLLVGIPSEQSLPLHPEGHTQTLGAVHMWLLSQFWQIAKGKKKNARLIMRQVQLR